MTQSRKDSSSDHSETTNNPVKQDKPKLTFLQSLVTGSAAGATEVMVDHPLWTMKTRMQSEQPFTLNPRLLYRGLVPNMVSMTPIAATQVALNSLLQNRHSKDSGELTQTQKVESALLAGAGSALISSPTEMVMTHQGKQGTRFLTAAHELAKQGTWSCLFRGLPATMMREGKFTAAYLAATPWVKDKLKPHCENDTVASVGAGVVTGAGAALASQPDDTLKTKQQAADPKQPLSLVNAAKQVYSKEGVMGFFKGGFPRGVRVMAGVTIYGKVTEEMTRYFQGSKPKK